MASIAITTLDNPFNPFTEFTSWLMYDNDKGYGTVDYLGRIAKVSDELSDEDNEIETERAIDDIIRLDPLNIYKKVRPSDFNKKSD